MNSMLFRFVSPAVIGLAMTVVVGAQTPPQSQQPPQPQPQSQPQAPTPARTDQTTAQRGNMGEPTTVTGCLMLGKDVAAMHRSAAGAANANDFFLASTATTGATTPTTPTAVYRITGLDKNQLQPHVNHQIELKGHLMGPNMTTTGTTPDSVARTGGAPERAPDAQRTPPERKAEAGHENAGVIHATSVRMLSATCPAAK